MGRGIRKDEEGQLLELQEEQLGHMDGEGNKADRNSHEYQ